MEQVEKIKEPSAQRERRKQRAFTLVETAIVMIIFGILVGSVLKGKELVDHAQVLMTIQRIKSTEVALTTFTDIYGAIPGDFPGAGRLPGCPVQSACGSGNLDGVIGTRAAPADAGAAVSPPSNSNEVTAFFSHLAAAGLLRYSAAIPVSLATGDAVPGTPIPETSLRIGYVGTIPTGSQGGPLPSWTFGHYLTITSAPPLAVGSSGNSGLSPSQALRIDRKLDDGLPQSGSIRAGGAASCINSASGTAIFDTSVSVDDCAVFINLESFVNSSSASPCAPACGPPTGNCGGTYADTCGIAGACNNPYNPFCGPAPGCGGTYADTCGNAGACSEPACAAGCYVWWLGGDIPSGASVTGCRCDPGCPCITRTCNNGSLTPGEDVGGVPDTGYNWPDCSGGCPPGAY